MFPLTLLMCALLGAVLVQAVIRTRMAPARRWVSVGKPRIAMARRNARASRIDPPQIGAWENEGGSVAPGDSPRHP